jgi:hypothetical protein
MAEARGRMAHLYRRARFGAGPEELDRAVARGYEATVEALVATAQSGAGVDSKVGLGAKFAPVGFL